MQFGKFIVKTYKQTRQWKKGFKDFMDKCTGGGRMDWGRHWGEGQEEADKGGWRDREWGTAGDLTVKCTNTVGDYINYLCYFVLNEALTESVAYWLRFFLVYWILWFFWRSSLVAFAIVLDYALLLQMLQYPRGWGASLVEELLVQVAAQVVVLVLMMWLMKWVIMLNGKTVVWMTM